MNSKLTFCIFFTVLVLSRAIVWSIMSIALVMTIPEILIFVVIALLFTLALHTNKEIKLTK